VTDKISKINANLPRTALTSAANSGNTPLFFYEGGKSGDLEKSRYCIPLLILPRQALSVPTQLQ
jgi:hypothetical protein